MKSNQNCQWTEWPRDSRDRLQIIGTEWPKDSRDRLWIVGTEKKKNSSSPYQKFFLLPVKKKIFFFSFSEGVRYFQLYFSSSCPKKRNKKNILLLLLWGGFFGYVLQKNSFSSLKSVPTISCEIFLLLLFSERRILKKFSFYSLKAEEYFLFLHIVQKKNDFIYWRQSTILCFRIKE